MTTPKTPFISRAALLVALATSAGCDDLANDQTHGDPLLTIRGSMVRAESAPALDGDIRLALAWYPEFVAESEEPTSGGDESCVGGFPTGLVAQDLAYEPIFPIEFRFDVTAPPPPEAQVYIEEVGGMAAVGLLVAYQDRNGNGALDECPVEGPCPDDVLGASGSFFPEDETTLIIFVDRPYTDDEVTFEPGLNLVRLSLAGAPEVLPADTAVRLELTGSLAVQQVACEAVCFESSAGGPRPCTPDDPECTSEPPPIPEGATVECAPDGRSYSWWLTTCETTCSCSSEGQYISLTPEQPVPEGWPCPMP